MPCERATRHDNPCQDDIVEKKRRTALDDQDPQRADVKPAETVYTVVKEATHGTMAHSNEPEHCRCFLLCD